MSMKTERVFWLVLKSAIKHKLLIVLAFAANTIAAMFEGVSLALLALSISVITGDNGASSMTQLSTWVDRYSGFSVVDFSRDQLFFVLIATAIIGQLIKAGFQYSGLAATIYLRTHAIGDLQSQMVRQIMAFSLAQVNRYPGGELSTYVGMAAGITTFLLTINSVVSKALLTLSYIMVMTFISMSLTIGSLVTAGILMLLISRYFVKIKEYGREVTQVGIRLGKAVMEFFYAPKFLRIYGRENYAGNVIITQIEKGLSARRKGELLRAAIQPSFDSIAIAFAGILLIGGYFMLSDADAASRLPTLLAFVMVFRRLMTTLSDLNGDRAAVANLMPSAEIVAEVLRTDNKDFTRSEGLTMTPLKSQISLHNVCFTYNGDKKTILSGIDLVVSKGSVVGIVGESGAGKTTLVELILGLYPPVSGDINMDGISILEALPESWHRQFGVVSQDSTIFNKSIKINLSIVNPNASDEDIIRACKVAYAHDFIISQPKGYDTVIGDRGHKLSGGQIQRIALARAILSDASILILDEATSALDSLSERRIIKAVNQLGEDRTIIQIAHRLSTIYNADFIIVMKAGKIIERGSHSQLLKVGGEYARMWSAQSSTNELQHVKTA